MLDGRQGSRTGVSRRLVTALPVLLASGAARAAASPDLNATLERAMSGHEVPGLAALVIRDLKAGGEAVRGVRRIGEADPVRPGDRWLLGSNGKAMTATLVARLVDRGKLSWDTPLERMLPQLSAGMRPEYRGVTLVDLLSHRAGLPENLGDEAYFRSLYDDPRPPAAQRLAYIQRALAEAPIGPVRGKPSYSNTGFVTAGVVAERAADSDYEALMEQEVFRPLGMTSAYFLPWRPPGPVGHVDRRPALRKYDPNPPMLDPAGGASMSLPDWAKFCIDQLAGARGQGRLLTPASYRRLQTDHDDGFGFGLGWGVSDKVLGRQGPALTHSGSDGNWYAVVVLLPQGGDGVLVAANAADSMGGDRAAVAVAREVLATLAPPAA